MLFNDGLAAWFWQARAKLAQLKPFHSDKRLVKRNLIVKSASYTSIISNILIPVIKICLWHKYYHPTTYIFSTLHILSFSKFNFYNPLKIKIIGTEFTLSVYFAYVLRCKIYIVNEQFIVKGAMKKWRQ